MTIFLVILAIVALIALLAFGKSFTNKVYILTGYNGFGETQRFLCSSVLIILCIIYIIWPDEYALGLLSLVPVVALIIMNLKAEKPAYIITLSVLQILYSIIWFIFFLVKITFKYALNMDFSPVSLGTKPLMDATLERAEWRAKNKGYADVAAWVAAESSYPDVDSAYKGGFFNGKLY